MKDYARNGDWTHVARRNISALIRAEATARRSERQYSAESPEQIVSQSACPARRWVAAVWGRGVGPGKFVMNSP